MGPVRLRHPNGVATIQIPFDQPDYTVQDLQQEISKITDIRPSLQDLKSGYPPQTLALIPELPVSSLGLKAGEQIIVVQKPEAGPVRGTSVAESDRARSAPAPAPAPVRARAPIEPLYEPSYDSPVLADLPSSASEGPDHVELEDGVLVHRVVPDDNSCLFSSIALVFAQGISSAPKMRQIVADGIAKDPEKYNEAILGMPPSKYTATILKPMTWGGAIELTVFANHFNTEIASIDVETGRIDHFTPDMESRDDNEDRRAPGSRCILIYSGIHYDAATLAPVAEAPEEWHQTVFPITFLDDKTDPVLVAAKKLADILRGKKAFTNTSTFDLKCEDCGQGLKGEKDARAHAEQTGHVRFGEY